MAPSIAALSYLVSVGAAWAAQSTAAPAAGAKGAPSAAAPVDALPAWALPVALVAALVVGVVVALIVARRAGRGSKPSSTSSYGSTGFGSPAGFGGRPPAGGSMTSLEHQIWSKAGANFMELVGVEFSADPSELGFSQAENGGHYATIRRAAVARLTGEAETALRGIPEPKALIAGLIGEKLADKTTSGDAAGWGWYARGLAWRAIFRHAGEGSPQKFSARTEADRCFDQAKKVFGETLDPLAILASVDLKLERDEWLGDAITLLAEAWDKSPVGSKYRPAVAATYLHALVRYHARFTPNAGVFVPAAAPVAGTPSKVPASEQEADARIREIYEAGRSLLENDWQFAADQHHAAASVRFMLAWATFHYNCSREEMAREVCARVTGESAPRADGFAMSPELQQFSRSEDKLPVSAREWLREVRVLWIRSFMRERNYADAALLVIRYLARPTPVADGAKLREFGEEIIQKTEFGAAHALPWETKTRLHALLNKGINADNPAGSASPAAHPAVQAAERGDFQQAYRMLRGDHDSRGFTPEVVRAAMDVVRLHDQRPMSPYGLPDPGRLDPTQVEWLRNVARGPRAKPALQYRVTRASAGGHADGVELRLAGEGIAAGKALLVRLWNGGSPVMVRGLLGSKGQPFERRVTCKAVPAESAPGSWSSTQTWTQLGDKIDFDGATHVDAAQRLQVKVMDEQGGELGHEMVELTGPFLARANPEIALAAIQMRAPFIREFVACCLEWLASRSPAPAAASLGSMGGVPGSRGSEGARTHLHGFMRELEKEMDESLRQPGAALSGALFESEIMRFAGVDGAVLTSFGKHGFDGLAADPVLQAAICKVLVKGVPALADSRAELERVFSIRMPMEMPAAAAASNSTSKPYEPPVTPVGAGVTPELREAVQRWLGVHGGLLAGMPPLQAETVGSIWRSANTLLNSLSTRYTALRENGQFEDAARVERALQELRDIRWTASALGGSEGAA